MKGFVVFPGWQFYSFEPVCQLWIRSQGSFRNMQVYPHLSKIKSTMGLALNELVNIKYLDKWDVQPMSSKDGYKIVLSPGPTVVLYFTCRQGRFAVRNL